MSLHLPTPTTHPHPRRKQKINGEDEVKNDEAPAEEPQSKPAEPTKTEEKKIVSSSLPSRPAACCQGIPMSIRRRLPLSLLLFSVLVWIWVYVVRQPVGCGFLLPFAVHLGTWKDAFNFYKRGVWSGSHHGELWIVPELHGGVFQCLRAKD